jgi:hypothetical protein
MTSALGHYCLLLTSTKKKKKKRQKFGFDQ